MTEPYKIAIAGLGTVGAGLIRLITQNSAQLGARAGREIKVAAVSARDSSRDRGVDISSCEWFDDASKMAAEADADAVVELIGGSDGIAREVCEAALQAGRDVVTANKALLAHHGTALASMAEQHDRCIGYEAAVAGGIPIIKALREGLAGNRIDRIQGILNGTCNYILTAMRESGRAFEDVLGEAQELGYAEQDPSFDIDGVDAAHKLALLASVAFGRPVRFSEVHVEGIRQVSPVDIEFADELGYRIKLLGICRRTNDGIEQRVHPAMVPMNAPIGRVDGVDNAVVADGDFIGSAMFQGPGAGAGPTASAVAADIVDFARNHRLAAFGFPVATLEDIPHLPMDRHVGAYYIRLMVVDRPGVIAEITAALRDAEVSVEAMLQRARAPGNSVPVVITTHEVREASMVQALDQITALDTVLESPCMIRIETSDNQAA